MAVIFSVSVRLSLWLMSLTLFIWCEKTCASCQDKDHELPQLERQCSVINKLGKSLIQLVDSLAYDKNDVNADSYFALELTATNIDNIMSSKQAVITLQNCLPTDFYNRVVNQINSILHYKYFYYSLNSRTEDSQTYYRIVEPVSIIYKRMYDIIPWQHVQSDVNSLLTTKESQSAFLNSFTEYDSFTGDVCLAEALSQRGCYISNKCKNFFGKTLQDSTNSGYYLTHSILYFTILRENNCLQQTPMQSAEYFNNACAKAWNEYKYLSNLVQADYPSPTDMKASSGHDLLLEQGMICGSLGYVEFFQNHTILDTVFTWQDNPSGCLLLRYTDGTVGSFGRRLLTTTLMKNGCSSHATSMAAIYYSLNLQYFNKKFSDSLPEGNSNM